MVTILVAFVLGVVCGAAGRWWWMRPRVSQEPPAVGVGVLVNAEGAEVSRVTLREPKAELFKYHGRQPVERFVYAGRRDDGVMVFQVRR